MIGVLIPAHDEEELIGRCLASVVSAACHPGLRREPVCIVVALDRCSDLTMDIARSFDVHTIDLAHGNVGLARAAGARFAIDNGARWLATTDADSTVPFDWLTAQLAAEADAFCGIVAVRDWQDYAPEVATAFELGEIACDDHPHVHGANLGVRTDAYERCGGFRPLEVSEDVALIDDLVAIQASIARHGRPVVLTSARRHARAVGGFGDYLLRLERAVSAPALVVCTDAAVH